jgi:hypothetical protein
VFLGSINGSKKVEKIWYILKEAVVQKDTEAVKMLKNIQNLAFGDKSKQSTRLIVLKYW